MKHFDVTRFGLLALAGGMLAGCGGDAVYQAQHGASVYSYDVRTSSVRRTAIARAPHDRSRSWMALGATNGGALVYISSEMTQDVDVYSYPKGIRKGVLAGFNSPQGLCSDSNGNIFIPEQLNSDIVEYAHGGTSPITTLSDSGEDPISCSVDSTTGTLAVANVTGYSFNAGSISLYHNASGTPQIVSDPDIDLFYECGYDDKGNLFVDGLTNFPSAGGVFQFAELPKGSGTFTNITLAKKIAVPGMVQWDGKYVTVGDAKTGAIYFTNGAGGKIIASAKLHGTNYDFQPWIQGKTIVVPSFYSIYTGFWHYPAGGKAYKRIKIGSPFGATVSVAPK